MADLLLDSKEVILKTPGKVDGEMVKGWCGVQMSEIRMVILLVIYGDFCSLMSFLYL